MAPNSPNSRVHNRRASERATSLGGSQTNAKRPVWGRNDAYEWERTSAIRVGAKLTQWASWVGKWLAAIGRDESANTRARGPTKAERQAWKEGRFGRGVGWALVGRARASFQGSGARRLTCPLPAEDPQQVLRASLRNSLLALKSAPLSSLPLGLESNWCLIERSGRRQSNTLRAANWSLVSVNKWAELRPAERLNLKAADPLNHSSLALTCRHRVSSQLGLTSIKVGSPPRASRPSVAKGGLHLENQCHSGLTILLTLVVEGWVLAEFGAASFVALKRASIAIHVHSAWSLDQEAALATATKFAI